MKYIKCPVCEVNYMFETEDMCELCYANSNPSTQIVRKQKSTNVTIDQFFAGENQQVVRLTEKLMMAEIEKFHPNTSSYTTSGTDGHKGYLAFKKAKRNYAIFELAQDHLRVNLLCTPDIYRQLNLRVDVRVSDGSCAFNVDNESQLEDALTMIEWAYENR